VTNSCNTSTYFTDPTGNETIDDTQSDGVNDQYYQYKVTLSTSDGANAPTLSDVTVNYEELTDVTIDGPDETKIQNAVNKGYISVDNGTIDNTTQTTTQLEVTFQSNNADAVFPTNTQIEEESSSNFDFSSFITENVTSTVMQSLPHAVSAVRLGVPNESLTFSNNITMTIHVSSPFEGMEMDVLSQKEGEATWNNHTTCTITNGDCTFTTNHATTYVVNGDGTITGSDQQNISATVQENITLSCNNVDIDGGTPIIADGSTTAANTTTCQVTTNDTDGYHLQIRQDTQLTHATASTTIADKTDWDGTNAQAYTPTGLAFRVSDNDTNAKNDSWWGTATTCTGSGATELYAGLPANLQDIVEEDDYTANTSTTDICYAVSVPSTQTSGEYTGQVTYSVTTGA
jgi:hypothetical protein